MTRLTIFLLLALMAFPAHAKPNLPDTIVLSPEVLYETRQRILKRDPAVLPAYRNLINDANRAIDATAKSVVLKPAPGPSGDPQDYWSLSPHWWPDPEAKDGLPYIRKDGKRNPEAASSKYDRTGLSRMSEDALTLALAFYLTGNEGYAGKATALIWAWCCDSKTRMNPNMLYARSRPGVLDGHHTGIIETRDLIRVVDAARLLEPSHSWSKVVTRKLSDWLTEYTNWLMKSDFARDEAHMEDSHGTWFDAQVAVFAAYTGQDRLARSVLISVPQRRITRQIGLNGSMPRELERPRSRNATFFNLEAFFVLACVGERLNVDLWRWTDPAGPSIHRAFNLAAEYIDPRKTWPHGRTGAFNPDLHIPLFRRAALVYKEPRYLEYLDALPADELKRHRSTLFY